MKREVICIFVCTLLIASALPAIGAESEEKNIKIISENKKPSSVQPPEIEWVKTFGGSEYDAFRGIAETSDGGFIVGGMNERSNSVYPWVLKLDSDGNEEWNWTIVHVEYEEIVYNITDTFLPYIIRYNDEYIICTQLEIYDPINETTGWFGGLLKFDEMGNGDWFSFLFDFDEGYAIYPQSIMEIEDGFIICGGGLYIGSTWITHGCLAKIDFSGTIQWYKFYNYGEDVDEAYGFGQTSDGGYILSGTVNVGTSSQDVWLVKTDADGNHEWNKTFGGPANDQSFSPHCFETDDGGFLISAWVINNLGAGLGDLWIIKTDSSGNMEWNDTFGTDKWDASWCASIANDEGYVFLVTHDYSGANDYDSWVIKTDDDGNAFWTVKIEDPNLRECTQQIRKTSDNGYILVGRTGMVGVNWADALIIKLGPEQPVEQPEMKVKRPKARWIYLFNFLGLPFPLTKNALILSDYFTIKVKAEDVSGIEKIEFFIDGLIIGEINATPYKFDWTGAEKGTYNLKVRAYSNNGGTMKKEVTVKKLM